MLDREPIMSSAVDLEAEVVRQRPQVDVRRWRQRPVGSNWGDFGDDDELGRLNYLTPDVRKLATRYVHEGLAFCLSLPFDRSGDTDDVVNLAPRYSTHWDTFAHGGQSFDADGDGIAEMLCYNGWRPNHDSIAPDPETGAARTRRLGFDTMARTCVQGRGVMIDLCHHLGRDRQLVSYDDIMRIIEVDRIEVNQGDFVCFYSGFGDLVLSSSGMPDHADVRSVCCPELNGRDQRLLRWIDQTGLAALISDNVGIEARLARHNDVGQATSLPLHEFCLFKVGIALGKLWYLSELAAWMRRHSRRYFLLTAPPLRLPGAVGSPVTPVATV
jgi:hypothetical protein